ncbi:unnamed protein product [Closterium sp. NIES-53]
MATPNVLAFEPDGRPIEFTVWLDDLQLFLLTDAKDGVLLFDYVSGTAVTPAADAPALERSQWQTRDAAARLAIRNHLPITERAHFSQHRIAKTLYDAVVARYSSPATAAIGRLMLPHLFPDLSSFTIAEDLVSHLRATDSRFRAALSAECLLSHDTLLWHHRLGHPSLPRLRSMHSRLLVSGLPRSLPPLPPSPALPCIPCVEGRQRAAPHSSSFPPTEAPLQTLHLDVWGPARVRGQGLKRYFLLVVDDYTRGGEFSLDLLAAFCAEHGIRQTFTLPTSPQQNGVAERRIGLVMEVTRTSMIHAAAPHFLWPFAVRYAAHQLNLWPRVSLPETSPTLLWTGKVGDASRFWVWGARAFVHDTTADKLSPRAIPCVFLGFVPDAPGWQFYDPASHRVFASQDVTLDESVPFYRLFPYRAAPRPPRHSFSPQVDPPAPAPVEVTGDSGPAASGAVPGGAELGGAESGGTECEEPGGAASGGAACGGAEPACAEPGGAESGGESPEGSTTDFPRSPWSSRLRPRVPLTSQQLHDWYGRRQRRASAPQGSTAGGSSAGVAGPGGARLEGTGAAGAGGIVTEGTGAAEGVGAAGGTGAAGGAGGAGAAEGTGAAGGAGPAEGLGATGGARAAGGAGDAGGAGATGAGGTAQQRLFFAPPSPSSQPPPDSTLRQVLGLPSSTGLPLQPDSPLPAPSPYTEQTRGLAERREPASRPVSPVRSGRFVRRPSSLPLRVPLPSPPSSSLPVVAGPASDQFHAEHSPVTRLLATVVTDPSFESAAASALVAELVDFAVACRLDYATSLVADSESICPPSVGGECALDTNVLEDRQKDLECLAAAAPHLAEAIASEYSSQWQTAMDAQMASWKSTSTYVDEVPPPGANIVSGMWIFRVKRPPGSPPVFKARYVARGFSQREGVDFFQTFSPTPKMTTLRVLLHVAAQREYKLHSLDFSTAFLQGSLHEEIWLRRPQGFTGSFPPGTQWSLRRPVYGLRQAPREWHDTLRTTLAALGFAPSTGDPSLFLRTNTSLPPFYVLVYVDDLVFATADTEALALVLQHFGFTWSSAQATPLATGHSLSAPPSDESVEPSGPYPELVGCLMYLMTCTRPDLAYPLGLLARYVAPGWHRKVHMDAAKRVLRYLCSTSGMGLVLGGRGDVVLTGHSDASWVDDQTTQRSSQGYTFSLGSGSVSWRSIRSSSILGSSCEAEIYATALAAQELRWLTYLLTDLGERPRSPPVLYVDNKAAIALCQEHRLEHRTKHIALRYFLARELQQRGQLRLTYVATRANTADIFTKALPPGDHQRFCTLLGLVPTLPHLLLLCTS